MFFLKKRSKPRKKSLVVICASTGLVLAGAAVFLYAMRKYSD